MGAIGLEHIRNLMILDGARVVAVADTAPKSLEYIRAREEELGVLGTSYHSDYRELLASADVDAVIIGTPNYTHIEVLRDAMASSKHLLCEKPLCTTIEVNLQPWPALPMALPMTLPMVLPMALTMPHWPMALPLHACALLEPPTSTVTGGATGKGGGCQSIHSVGALLAT